LKHVEKRHFASYMISFSIAGIVAGYALLHPLSMYIHFVTCEPSVDLLKIIKMTVSLDHLPMALFFCAIGGFAGVIQGLYVGRLLSTNIDLKNEAIIDHLTGLYTRRFIFAELDREIKRSRRTGESFAVTMIDLDHFKAYNDTHGHLVGDELLRRFGRLLQTIIRESDLSGRYGGEEFVIVFQDMKAAQASVMIDRFRDAVAKKNFFEMPGISAPPVTFSAGVAEFPGDAQGIIELIDRADRALFKAKRQGRNQTCIADASDLLVKRADN